MSSQLDPYIRTKLVAFRGRFRWLVFLRGVSCGLLALLGGGVDFVPSRLVDRDG